MTAEQILAAINVVCSRGGDVCVEAVDPRNPGCGYQARVRLAVPLKSGPPTYLGVSDTDATEALVMALRRAKLLG